jgi:NRAMP (natural resistance-associated macrophage protein)-like metal ion transporter
MTDHKKSNSKNHAKKRPGNDKPAPKAGAKEPFSFRYFLRALGPGLITGASDDDPSGIGTYSQAGAQLGYGIGWTMLLTFPLMVAIQEISARVGRVTGHGISGNVCRHYSSWLLNMVVALLFIANTINIAADLAAMADATKLLIGGPGIVYVMFFGVTSVVAQIFLDYKRYVAVLKWLTLSLFAYVAALAFAHISWGQALAGILVPRFTWSVDYFTTIVAILGTTISPYLFFWQASQEAEDQRVDTKKQPLIEKHYGAQREFHRIRADTIVGMAFSNLIALSIIVTAAATLHAAGKTDIQTSAQAAEALKPIAGKFAEVVFALGIVGTGLLAIPVLAGATAYAVGEGRRWPVGGGRAWGGRARPPPQGSGRLLRRAGAVGGNRHRAEFHADQSDLGAVLERGHQRRTRRSRNGAVDVHVAPPGRHGPLCHRWSAILAGLALDRGDAAERRSDGRGVLCMTSFRGDVKHRTTMCGCTSENLEIPGLVLRTIPE